MRGGASSPELGVVLAGAGGIGAARRVLADPLAHGAAGLLDLERPVRPPLRLQLLRSKFKPGRKLSGEYLLCSDGVGVAPLHAVVSWTMTPAGADVAVSVSPLDDRMPRLQQLTDAGHVTSLIRSMCERRAHPLRVTRMRTVRYRPGQRHVLVAELADGVESVYVKTDRDGSGDSALRVARNLQQEFCRTSTSATVVQPLGWSAEDAAALWWEMPGVPLARLVASGRCPAVAPVGRALRVVHGTPLPTAVREGSGTAHDAASEARATLNAGAHIQVLVPGVWFAYTALVSDLVELLERDPDEAPVLAHGDFKCDNILLDHGAPTILDLDRACAADPALDLGKFLADLAWWQPRQRHQTDLEEAFRAGYGACDAQRWKRARRWAALYALKHTARRCLIHQPDFEHQVERRVRAACRLLSSVGGP